MSPAITYTKNEGGEEILNFELHKLLTKSRLQTVVGLFVVLLLLVGLASVTAILWGKVVDVESRNDILQNSICKLEGANPAVCSILAEKHIREKRDVGAAPHGGVTLLSLNSEEIVLTHRNEVVGPFQLNVKASGKGPRSIQLNSDKSSMTVMEEGVYSVFAQVLYHVNLENNGPDDTDFLGYQVTLSPKSNSSEIVPMAECVTPPLLKNSFTTCFTQVARFLEVGDVIQMRNLHFTPNGLSTIISDNEGQTFFGASKF